MPNRVESSHLVLSLLLVVLGACAGSNTAGSGSDDADDSADEATGLSDATDTSGRDASADLRDAVDDRQVADPDVIGAEDANDPDLLDTSGRDAAEDRDEADEVVPDEDSGHSETDAAPDPGPFPPGDGTVVDYGREQGIHIVYFVPSDREPIIDYRARGQTLAFALQDSMARSLRYHHLGDSGPQFVMDDDGVVVELVRGTYEAAHYRDGDTSPNSPLISGMVRGDPVMADVVTDDRLVIVLPDVCLREGTYTCIEGGLARGIHRGQRGGYGFFTATLFTRDVVPTTWAEQLERFADTTPRGEEGTIYDYVTTVGEMIDDEVGAVVHELGHAMAAPHDVTAPHVNIMSAGFRQLRDTYLGPNAGELPVHFSYANSLLIAFNAWVNPDADWSDDTRPEAFAVATYEGDEVTVWGLVRDEGVVEAVHVTSQNSEANKSWAAGELVGAAEGWFEVTLPLEPEGETHVIVRAIDQGGNRSLPTIVTICPTCDDPEPETVVLPSFGSDDTGTVFAEYCREGTSITGVDVTWDRAVTSVEVRCATSGWAIAHTLPLIGEEGSDSGRSRCGRGEVAVGFHGRAAFWPDALGVLCADRDDWAEGPAEVTAETARGGEGGDAVSHQCPSGYRLVGVWGNADEAVRQLDGICQRL